MLVKYKKYLVATLLVSSLLVAGYIYLNRMLLKIAVLEKNNVTLNTAVELQKTTIADQSEAITKWNIAQQALIARMNEIQEVAHEAAAQTRFLNETFAKHDFTFLAKNKPGLIEKRVNSGTADIIRLLRCASGARDNDCRN